MPTSLLFLQLLANRALEPAGFRLGFAELDADALVALAARAELAALAAEFPCLILTDDIAELPVEAWQALQAIGCQPLDPAALAACSSAGQPSLPPGAQWLSGKWYLAPPAKPQSNQIGSRALALKLVQLVAADAENRELEAVFRVDPALSYHLLRLVNSLGVGAGRRINSFNQALIMLGRAQLRRWLNLMLFAAGKDDPRSPMLLAHATVRARTMELLAQAAGMDRQAQDQAFMSGMFSLLGVLFGLPLTQVLEPLRVGEALTAAVLRHEGALGHLLRAAEYDEERDGAGLHAALDQLALTPDIFDGATLEAHRWMLNLLRETPGSGDA